MKKKITSVSCVITVIFLIISPMAHADSWVLWNKKEYLEKKMKQEIFWEIADAYPEYKQCLQALVKLWNVEKNQAIKDRKESVGISKVEEVPNTMIITYFKESSDIISIAETLYCLPGTLDPREKK